MTTPARALDWWLEMPPSDDELVFEDGEPMDSPDHRRQAALLVALTTAYYADRDDVYVGANEALYFSSVQARNRDFRAPDYFVVIGCDGRKYRKGWVVWNEEGKVPDLVVELLSPTTEDVDRTVKRDTYERLGVKEYVLFDVLTNALEGYRTDGTRYVPVALDPNGRFSSRVLGLDLGLHVGALEGVERPWLRLFTPDGRLVPTAAEAEAQRAEAEAQRAEALAARLAAYEARFGPLDEPAPGDG
jgi:Uma2 family endonuclease